jgi:hypothetical protein
MASARTSDTVKKPLSLPETSFLSHRNDNILDGIYGLGRDEMGRPAVNIPEVNNDDCHKAC